MAVDLHLHSTESDGTDPPTEVVQRAADAGLSAIALTDHDTLDGIPAAQEAAAAAGIRLIAGIELSVEWPTGTMHMLIYHLEGRHGPLQDKLAALRDARARRNEQILERLAGLGIEISLAEVHAEAGDGVVGRPHIAAVLLDRGHASSIADAFDRFLARGRAGYVDRRRLDAFQAIDLARRSGAVPVLAHPHTIGVAASEYEEAFRLLADAGLAGIEAYYAEYEPALRTHLAALSERLGLIATGGSDYHGRYKPGLAIGSGHGDLVVPDDAVTHLEALARPG